ncbi:MAG: hypothetical protein HZA91_09320 [Verrucomicrobia bacterium]|nr:hypothetical protein [Verrucomicrobiota bacterium]
MKGKLAQMHWEKALDLEFPDWSGHIERPAKMSADEMLRYCESLLPRVRKFPGRRKERLAARCSAEFILK